MRLFMCAIFDSKVGAYATPFAARSRGEAIRSFHSATLDDSLPFKKYPGDYRLFFVGEFDDAAGLFIPVTTPEPLIGADEFGVQPEPLPWEGEK